MNPIGLVDLSKQDLVVLDALPSNVGRSSLVDELLRAYKLDVAADHIARRRVGVADLARYHSRDYCEFLLGDRHDDEGRRKYGLEHDCPVFPQMSEYARTVAGTTVAAAGWVAKHRGTAINWHGGRHHCFKSRASGFCYVNDIVLGISELRRTFQKVMYVDLDVHHGDGVAKAFQFSSKVLTLSLHHFDVGFFPGTGDVDSSNGPKGCDVNVPLRRGLSDESLMKVVERIVLPTLFRFEPDCLVLQCGADGLVTEESHCWNLTIRGYARSVSKLLETAKLPTLVLGGGGYNHLETAKLWAYITGCLVHGVEPKWDYIPLDVDDYEFFGEHNRESKMRDLNDDQYIQSLADRCVF